MQRRQADTGATRHKLGPQLGQRDVALSVEGGDNEDRLSLDPAGAVISTLLARCNAAGLPPLRAPADRARESACRHDNPLLHGTAHTGPQVDRDGFHACRLPHEHAA